MGTTWDRVLAPPRAGGRKPCRDWGHPGPNKSAPAKRLAHQGRQKREGQRTPAVLASPDLWVTGAQVPPEHSLHSWSCGLGRRVLLPPCARGEGCESHCEHPLAAARGPMGIKPPWACQAGSHCDLVPDQRDVLTPGCRGTHTPTGRWVPRAGRGWSECRELPRPGPAPAPLPV